MIKSYNPHHFEKSNPLPIYVTVMEQYNFCVNEVVAKL